MALQNIVLKDTNGASFTLVVDTTLLAPRSIDLNAEIADNGDIVFPGSWPHHWEYTSGVLQYDEITRPSDSKKYRMTFTTSSGVITDSTEWEVQP